MSFDPSDPLDEQSLLLAEREAGRQLAEEREAQAAWLDDRLQTALRERDEALCAARDEAIRAESLSRENHALQREKAALLRDLEPMEKIRRVARRIPGGTRVTHWLGRRLR